MTRRPAPPTALSTAPPTAPPTDPPTALRRRRGIAASAGGPRRTALALVACGAASLAGGAALAPVAAQADSVVFVKDANIWLANPDGSGLYQVTTDGTADNPWQSPSQADDGTIVAVRAHPNLGPIVRMRQNGSVVNEIPVPPMQFGPFEPAISPNGRLVAYEDVFTNTFETSSDVRITNVDGLTPVSVYGHTGSGAGSPSWIGSDRIFVGDYSQVFTHVPGQPPVEWWNESGMEDVLGPTDDLDDGEVAANGSIAFVRGDRDGNTIQLYRSNGLGAEPTPTCVLSNPSPGPNGARFSDPTFSPSGEAIAWQEGDGIWTATLGAGDCAAAALHLTIPGASEPDWGPAAINPGPRQAPLGGDQPRAGTPPNSGVPGPAGRTVQPRTPGVRKPGAPSVRTPGGPGSRTPGGPGARTPGAPGARTGTPAACARLAGAKRDACVLASAVARCNAGPKRRRAACVRSAKRTAAIRACTRKPAKARKRCVAAARRHYR